MSEIMRAFIDGVLVGLLLVQLITFLSQFMYETKLPARRTKRWEVVRSSVKKSSPLTYTMYVEDKDGIPRKIVGWGDYRFQDDGSSCGEGLSAEAQEVVDSWEARNR